MKYLDLNINNYVMRVKSKEGGIHSDLRKIGLGKKKNREPELLYVIEEEIKPGMVVMDLGANIGYITLFMHNLLKNKGKIYAVEPEPENFNLLTYNIEINKIKNIIELYNLAISNKTEILNFYIGKSSNLSSMTKTKNSTNKIIKVESKTLTDFFINKELPNLIKLDTEGHEVEIFNGAYELFKNNLNHSCLIILEMHPIFYTEKHNLEVEFKKFLDIGFNTKYVISAGVPIPDLFKKHGYTPDKVFRNRGVYTTVNNQDMLYFSCRQHIQKVPGKKDSTKIVRYVGLYRGK